ncbi:Glycosyltransferase, GT2 family [Filimonas lacunae]|uniref:Glycosyltransferase, GT2 family n=1 Tax=Filimonas lacunae TaxID=477680 RepID=A0A173MR77_9BACT|nr:glycosyltransferase family 2 protein [Filimonas lacunae]BAV10163.1 glycosyltransferase [Filimonas lacunae]SIT18698.1 Glycosyltransferase, GT2 family [Filimonas lacunae]
MAISKIAIVVVTYNREMLLRRCIEALRRQHYAWDKLFVINNGSTDGTKAWLDSQDDMEVIHQMNTGGAGGFYSGIKYAVEKNYDYIWVMDDDVMASEDALEQMMLAAELVPDFSFLCSKVNSTDGIIMNVPNIDNTRSKYNYPLWGEYAEHGLIRVSSSTFVSVLINARHVQKAGLPIRDFFIWGDDIDFTNRLSRQAPGYMVGKSKVVHLRSNPSFPSLVTEVDKQRIAMHFYNIRNNIYIGRKHKRRVELMMDTLHYGKIAIASAFTRNGWYKLGVYMKGFWAGLFFNPTIVYPNQKL